MMSPFGYQYRNTWSDYDKAIFTVKLEFWIIVFLLIYLAW